MNSFIIFKNYWVRLENKLLVFTINKKELSNGRYYITETQTMIYKQNTKMNLLNSLNMNMYSSVISSNNFIKRMIVLFFNVKYRSTLTINEGGNGDAIIFNTSGNDCKVVNLDLLTLKIIFRDKSIFMKRINDYYFFNKIFNIPVLLSTDETNLSITERFYPEESLIINEEEYKRIFNLIDEAYVKYKSIPFKTKNTQEILYEKSYNIDDFKQIVKFINKDFLNHDFPYQKMHGDFWSSNILDLRNEIIVLDFEYSENYIFFFDYFQFIWAEYTHKSNDFLIKKYFDGDLDIYFKKLFNYFSQEFDSNFKESYFSIFIINLISNRYCSTDYVNRNIILDKYTKIMRMVKNENL